MSFTKRKMKIRRRYKGLNGTEIVVVSCDKRLTEFAKECAGGFGMAVAMILVFVLVTGAQLKCFPS